MNGCESSWMDPEEDSRGSGGTEREPNAEQW